MLRRGRDANRMGERMNDNAQALARIDPRGLIREAYRMEGLGTAECRSIFLDWVLGQPVDAQTDDPIKVLLDHYAPGNDDHPMTAVLREGLQSARPPRRRGGRRARHTQDGD